MLISGSRVRLMPALVHIGCVVRRRPAPPAAKERRSIPILADLDKILDKAYESNSLAEILAAPVSTIAGISDADAELPGKAFGIKTVADLGKNKYFASAGALVELGG